MSSLRPLSIALLSALAFAPSAFAQDTSTDTASGKRIAIVGGGAILQPKSDPAPGLKVDGGTAPTLSASWYVNDNMAIELGGAADNVMRPFLGLGYYESNFSNEDISAGGPHVGLDTSKGAIATAGMDFNINPRWFARADVRYLKGDAGINVAGQSTGTELTLDPWTVGFGVGARF